MRGIERRQVTFAPGMLIVLVTQFSDMKPEHVEWLSHFISDRFSLDIFHNKSNLCRFDICPQNWSVQHVGNRLKQL